MSDLPAILTSLAWPFAITLAWLAGEFGQRWTGLPRISFYGLAGFVLAAPQLGLLPLPTAGTVLLLADVAFALILFELGYRINLRWLRTNPWLGAAGLAEAGLTFIAVWLIAAAFGTPTIHALMLASLSMATSPATVVRVINEQRSSGQVTERALHLCALNCVLAVFAFNATVGLWIFRTSDDIGDALWNSLVVLGVSAFSGAVFGVVVPALLRMLGKLTRDATVAFALAVILLVTIAYALGLSPVVAALAFGLMARHRRIVFSQAQRNFGALGELLTVVLFVFAASTLDWQKVWAGGALALAVVLARLLTKVAGVTAFAHLSGISWRKGALTGVALAPLSVFVILLIEHARHAGVQVVEDLRAVAAVTMPLEPFAASKALTFGVELELQLVSLSDFDLTPASVDLLHLLKRKPFPGNVVPEITESMIEINSSVHATYPALLAELLEIRDTLVAAGDLLNIGIAGGGTHPFQQWSEQRISSKQRYQELSALYGYLAKQFTVFGQHVHIGCTSGDDALYLLHALGRYIPHFIALSSSSPFVQGTDSGFDSARLNSVTAFPLSGRAPFTLRWDDFAGVYFAKMERTGIIKSMKDFYWDLRPKPEFGTIELRVCDTPLTVERAAALAAYLQALCGHLLARRAAAQEDAPLEDDYLVYNYNRFQAARFGLEGVITHPKTYAATPLRDDILATLNLMAPQAEALGSTEALAHLAAAAADGSDATWLRGQYRRQGSAEGMVNAAIGRFRGARRLG